MEIICPECGKGTELKRIIQPEEFEIKGEMIMVDRELLRCPDCGAEFEDMNSDIDPYKQAYEEYRKRKGMVFPAQIVEFRKKYDLTQKELSNLLGFGDITLSRYENGALQDEVHDQLLKFAMEKESLLSLIKQKPDVLPKDKQNEIRSYLEEEITLETTIDNIFNNGMPSFSTGNQVFNLSKVINLIKSFSYPNGVVKSKLLKLLFYADYYHYKKNNISITGLKYAHLPYGPVPDQYDFLLAAIQQIDKDILIEIQTYGEYVGEVFKSKKPPKQDVIDEEAKKSVLYVDSFFRGFSAKDIEDFSHDETGYKETVQGEIIPFTYAKDLKI